MDGCARPRPGLSTPKMALVKGRRWENLPYPLFFIIYGKTSHDVAVRLPLARRSIYVSFPRWESPGNPCRDEIGSHNGFSGVGTMLLLAASYLQHFVHPGKKVFAKNKNVLTELELKTVFSVSENQCQIARLSILGAPIRLSSRVTEIGYVP